MAKKFTKADMLEAVATVYEELTAGRTDSSIMDLLGVDAETYGEIKKTMLEMRSAEIRDKPREYVYVDYIVDQRKNIKALDTLITNLDAKSQYNALVGAIRLRSDITDKILETGQSLGYIKKTAEKRIIAGMVVGEMSTGDIRKAISDQSKMLSEVMEKFGDEDMMSVEPGPLHYGKPAILTSGTSVDDEEDDEAELAPKVPAKAGGSFRAKTAKRSAGRKRVREEE